jgi:CPA2 family monovalent cation:H+ antiporter-2
MPELKFLQDLAVVLAVAGIAGWLCQRIRLSVISGYLLAGVLLGPAGVITLVSDSESLRLLSQLGLIFLMFSIGQNLGIRQIRRSGIASLTATAVSTVLMFTFCRGIGSLIGLDETGGLLLAGLFITSSSVIIGRLLHESGRFHRATGQAAMFQTLLEDFNVIILLSLLSSRLHGCADSSSPILQELGSFASFVVLIAILALLFMPRMLHILQQTVRPELRNVILAAVLVGTAVLARSAGYSFALGAFVLGMAVAGTPDRPQIEKAFAGLSDLFGAVFFVSIGMLIDIRHIFSAWPLVLLFTALAVFGRSTICMIGQLAAGRNLRDAVTTGLLLVPLGEFSFLVAQIGIDAGRLPTSFGAVIVGVSILSTVAASVLLPVSGRVADWLVACQPHWFEQALSAYQNGLSRLAARRSSNMIWKISRKCLIQIAVEMLFVTGLMVFSPKLYAMVAGLFSGQEWMIQAVNLIFWIPFGLVVLVALVAVWRNIEVLILLHSETAAWRIRRESHAAARMIEQALRIISLILLSAWLWMLLPFALSGFWTFIGLTAVAVAGVAFLWKPMVFLHSVAENRLYSIAAGKEKPSALIFRNDSEWDLNIEEVLIPQASLCQGRSLAQLDLRNRFGCSVLGVERQGVVVDAPGSDFTVFPQDVLLLLGEPAKIGPARAFLGSTSMSDVESLDEIRLDTLIIPESISLANRTLAEWNIAHQTGVQIAAIRRAGKQIVTPGPAEHLYAGDELLVLGTVEKIRQLDLLLINAEADKPEPSPA